MQLCKQLYERNNGDSNPNMLPLQAVKEYAQAEVKSQQEEAKKLRLQVFYRVVTTTS